MQMVLASLIHHESLVGHLMIHFSIFILLFFLLLAFHDYLADFSLCFLKFNNFQYVQKYYWLRPRGVVDQVYGQLRPLDLSYLTIFITTIFFHRYRMNFSFQSFLRSFVPVKNCYSQQKYHLIIYHPLKPSNRFHFLLVLNRADSSFLTVLPPGCFYHYPFLHH